jgi:hypothetical protein
MNSELPSGIREAAQLADAPLRLGGDMSSGLVAQVHIGIVENRAAMRPPQIVIGAQKVEVPF